MQDNLVPMTIRLDPAVSEALARAALAAGQETADYAGDIIAHNVLDEIRKTEPDAAQRLQAEIEIKAEAIAYARRFVHDNPDVDNSDITLKVFRHIRQDERLNPKYSRAIGGRPADERGNHTKARINRSLGAAIKTALRATPRMERGKPAKVQVTGEFIFSYTPLNLPTR
ncbi:hypothetical protein JIR23_21495 [Bradyrhizobium diazoefficiens]|nr:hypothetical protein [Bradyrhizobium diazoefficiens]QQN62168.1 hypothetical protein JIR23_21495 [Bradyrhizobium diazoefficiens]